MAGDGHGRASEGVAAMAVAGMYAAGCLLLLVSVLGVAGVGAVAWWAYNHVEVSVDAQPGPDSAPPVNP